MENEDLIKEIDALIAELGDTIAIARPAAERAVLEDIRNILDRTREQRTGSARDIWEAYLPYAAKLCLQLTKQEAGWEDDLEYFASENSQFWLDCVSACLESGDITGVKNALGQIGEAARSIKQDMILRADILLKALDTALEISDKKRAILLYEEAEKLYRKHLSGGAAYTGSAWLRKIKKMGQQLVDDREKLRRYFQYAETVTVSIEADAEGDLERLIDYLQQSLPGKVKVTRRVKEAGEQEKTGASRFRARLRITLV